MRTSSPRQRDMGNPSSNLAFLSLPGRTVRTVADVSNDYGIPHHPDRFQEVTNSSWPPPEVARRLSDHASIPVRVRIVWDRDGETWLDGTATRWSGRHVFIKFTDERSRVGFAWVDAGDVKRP